MSQFVLPPSDCLTTSSINLDQIVSIRKFTDGEYPSLAFISVGDAPLRAPADRYRFVWSFRAGQEERRDEVFKQLSSNTYNMIPPKEQEE